MKLVEIATQLECRLVGDPQLEITGLATIETARGGHLTFLSNRKYKKHLSKTGASAIITDDPENLLEGQSGLISPYPYYIFARALALFYQPIVHKPGIDPLASVASTAIIGANVSVGPYSTVGDGAKIGDNVVILSHCAVYDEVEIGENSFIHSHCVIRERCKIGSSVTLQNNVVVGSDGFGYAKSPDNEWFKIPQTGIVVIEDNVEIGSGSVIDRATLGATVIGRCSKIDNLVQIGHGSTVGQRTLLCAQVGLAGSTQVGDDVILGGQVGAAGHLTIGDKVVATAQTGIPNSVEPGKVISGYPAIDNRDWLKSSAVFAQLPKLQKELREIKERLRQIESKLTADS